MCFSEEQLQRWLYWTKHLPSFRSWRNKQEPYTCYYSDYNIKAPLKPSNGSYRPYNIRVSHKRTTTLPHLLTNVKDRDEPNNKQRAVYKIKCSDCQTSYIGEAEALTGRSLNTRLTEHKRVTRNGDANNHIALHHQLTNHNIDWDAAQYLQYYSTVPTIFSDWLWKAGILT